MPIDGNIYPSETPVDHSIRLHQQLAADRQHRGEVMDWINNFNALRDKYNDLCVENARIGAQRDVAFEIVRENLSSLPLSRDEMNARIAQREKQAEERLLSSFKK